MKLLLGAVAAVCLAAGLASASAQAWKSDTSFASPGHSLKSAREALAAGYHSGAVSELNQVVGRVPDDAEVFFLLGAAHWGNGNRAEAHAALQKALALDSGLTSRMDEYPLGPGDAGRMTLQSTSATPAPKPARPAVSRSVPSAPPAGVAGDENTIGSAAYFLKYARSAMASGNPPGAAKYAREALKVDPNNAEAQRMLAAAVRAGPAKPRTCQQIWSACFVSARDFSEKLACNQRDLACKAGER